MKNEWTEYLVLGNSTAAVAAIEGIRESDSDATILLLSREQYHTYSRPLISHLLAGEISNDHLYFRPEGFYRDNGVKARLGVSAVKIEPSKMTVVTDDDTEIKFEKLLIATGGKPVMPTIEGTGCDGVFTFTSWDDAKAIDSYIRNHAGGKSLPRAVVIGSGLIGIKALESLRARGLEVLLVEREDRILPLSLDTRGSKLIEQAVWKAGADIQCGVTVDRIIGDKAGRVAGVALKAGREAPCELVVLAAGVTPAVDVAKRTPIEIDRGILIDERCMTSVPGIYAAGDVAQATDSLSGISRPVPIFCNAARQGRVAGLNMGGADVLITDNFAMNSLEIFGMSTISVGLSTACGDEFIALEKLDAAARTYRRVVLQDNRIVGAIFVGDIDRAGIVTGLIRAKVDVSSIGDALLTDDFGLLSLPLEYRKHIVKGEGIEV